MRVLITGAAGMLGSAMVPAFLAAGHEVTASDLVPRAIDGVEISRLDVRDGRAVRAASVRSSRTWSSISRPRPISRRARPIRTAPTERTRSGPSTWPWRPAMPVRPSSTSAPPGVFDGTKTDGPYTEFDAPNPINVYGDSKYQGERFVLRMVPRHFVVRAGWIRRRR